MIVGSALLAIELFIRSSVRFFFLGGSASTSALPIPRG